MDTKLYRATNKSSDAKTVPAGSCWTPRQDHAAEYTRRPNFAARKHIVSIDADTTYCLDLRGDNWSALENALGYDPRQTWTDGDLEYIEQAIDSEKIRRALSNRYDWVVYDDTFPTGCQTYVRL